MDRLPPEVDRFCHQILSPLTALTGAVGLLRRRYGASDDARLRDLIGALERATERLRVVGGRLTAAVAIEGAELVVRLPAGAYRDPAAAAADVVPTLLIGGAELDPLAAALAAAGWPTDRCVTGSAGLAAAALRPPGLVVIDRQIVDGELCGELLRADRGAGTVTLALAGRAPDSAGSGGPAWIDLAQPAAGLAAQAGAIVAAGAGRVLIVDDDAERGRALALQLAEGGLSSTPLPSGSAALLSVRRQRYELILLAMGLADIDSLAVLGGLRALAETQLTPVILLASQPAPAERLRGLEVGADDYLAWPAGRGELVARAQALLRRGELAGVAPAAGLPGRSAIERALRERLAGDAPLAVCYADISRLAAYRGRYGRRRGDVAVAHTARLLAAATSQHGGPGDLVGHLGGGAFMVLTEPARAGAIGRAALDGFAAATPLLCGPAARSVGAGAAEGARGRPRRAGPPGLVVVVVPAVAGAARRPAEIARRAAELRRRARRRAGSHLLLAGA